MIRKDRRQKQSTWAPSEEKWQVAVCRQNQPENSLVTDSLLSALLWRRSERPSRTYRTSLAIFRKFFVQNWEISLLNWTKINPSINVAVFFFSLWTIIFRSLEIYSIDRIKRKGGEWCCCCCCCCCCCRLIRFHILLLWHIIIDINDRRPPPFSIAISFSSSKWCHVWRVHRLFTSFCFFYFKWPFDLSDFVRRSVF